MELDYQVILTRVHIRSELESYRVLGSATGTVLPGLNDASLMPTTPVTTSTKKAISSDSGTSASPFATSTVISANWPAVAPVAIIIRAVDMLRVPPLVTVSMLIGVLLLAEYETSVLVAR